MTVIDTTKSPPVDAMRAAGVTGVCRYLSTIQVSTAFKRILKPEYDALLAGGFSVVLNWEFFATDWLGGASAGAAHAAEAVRQAKGLGYPAGCAIPGSADFNMSRVQWDTLCQSYARAYSQGIRAGGYVAGVYGPWDVLDWCRQLGGFGMYWQSMSTAWSAGRNAKLWPGAHLWQRGHLTIAGQDTDYNDVLQTNYGQAGGTMAQPSTSEVVRLLTQGSDDRGFVTDGTIDPATESVSPARVYNLKVVEERLTAAIGTVGQPTQEQVDAAVEKALPAALAAAGLSLEAIAKAVNDDAAQRLQA